MQKKKLTVVKGIHQFKLCYAEIETQRLEKMKRACIRHAGPRLRHASQ
jgi:hypothetical protein